ncbi:MAG: HD domain-containing protein [Ignavibacterium sp.]|nr:HD domain-containing protein [Ignavibacterium sp.]
MTTVEKIYLSSWWERAKTYPDRHFPKESGLMLSDNLLSVLKNSERIFKSEPDNDFYEVLYVYLLDTGFDLYRSKEILKVVALLHDIGKPEDDKEKEIEHPIKKTLVKKRHPVLGVCSAIEILDGQSDFTDNEKQVIFNLIDEHDTPFSWFRQFEKSKAIPEFKSWKKLDNKIAGDRNDSFGINMLALFKIADIDGHESIADLIWFFVQLNEKYLNQLGKPIPLPIEKDLIEKTYD